MSRLAQSHQAMRASLKRMDLHEATTLLVAVFDALWPDSTPENILGWSRATVETVADRIEQHILDHDERDEVAP